MTVNPENTGTSLKAFEAEINENVPSLRIGKQVPPGDVNLAYVHTPRINPDANMSMINTTDIYDNIIPADQKESLVAANAEGKLEYIELINESEVQTRAPESIFPSDHVTVTSSFKKKKFTRDTALYYRFELKYHYDSKEREVNKRVLYDGNQIKITDANGNDLDSSYNYEIYITPQAGNNRISLVEIYMHNKANENETFKVLYNHVDHIVQDGNIKAVKKKIELYSKKANTITEEGVLKAMMEGGKSRIINPISAFQTAPLSSVVAQQGNINPKEICAIEARPDTDGYEITVPQKASIDNRAKRGFSFRINAKFFANDGTEMKYTTGYMTNWVINKEALLEREKLEYSGDFKDVSGIIGMTKMDVHEMIIRSLPAGYTTKMNAIQYEIEDDKLNKLYTDVVNSMNLEVETRILLADRPIVQAKSVMPPQQKWLEAESKNSIIKNNRINHKCTVIAEKQKVLWKFKWEIVGKGKIYREDGSFKEWDTLKWKHIQGEAEVRYNPDGTYTSTFTPAKLPAVFIEDEFNVKELEWSDIIILEGDTDCGIEIINNIIRHKMLNSPMTEVIGTPYILPEDLLIKSEGVKKIGEIFGAASIYDKLNIPSDIALKDIALRIERGQSTISKLQNIPTMDFRVNYRFRVAKGGYEAMPVDQYHKWFGMNRIRLVDYLESDNALVEALTVDVVAWTMFEELEIAPIYAIRIEEDRRIDLEGPKVADDRLEYDNWYVKVKNGRMFKTIMLPGYDVAKGIIPQIYIAYPELIPHAPGLCSNKEVDLEYEVTEYPNQEFFGYQTMVVENEQPIIYDETTIKVINAPLYLDSEGEKGNIEVKCIRGNRSKILRIADVDSEKGMIYLLDKIHDQDILTVRYVYREMYYTYKGFESYVAGTSSTSEPYPFSIDVDAEIKMSIDINYTAPMITIEGPDTIAKGQSADYKVTVAHSSQNVAYTLYKQWGTDNTLFRDGTAPTLIYEFTVTIDSNDYDTNVSRFIYLHGSALADGMTANATKKIEIVLEAPKPVIVIDKLPNNEWCVDLLPHTIITGTVSHPSSGIIINMYLNGIKRGGGTYSEGGLINWRFDLHSVNHKTEYQQNENFELKIEVIIDGKTYYETYNFRAGECGSHHIGHEYQIKIVFEFGDILKKATGELYEEGDAGSLDSYLFYDKDNTKYINYQTRAYDSGNGKMYLDYDRVSTTKFVDGIVQKEILTIDKMKGSNVTYVLHDYDGFFNSQINMYTLSEGIKISVYTTSNGINDELIKTVNLDPSVLPVNTNTLVPGDFSNSIKKGYYSLFNISIPSTGKPTAANVKLINKQGVYHS